MIRDVKQDLVNKRFGSLTVLNDFQRRYVNQNGSTKIYWKCQCDCGNIMYLSRDSIKKRVVNYCPQCRQSGIRNDKLYHVYHGIKQRCYNKNNQNYHKYGANGISMCDEWLNNYDAFKTWAISNGYYYGEYKECTIDRIDSSKGYSPENCRWISLSENSARGNIGRQKVKTKLKDVYAVSENGECEYFTNISEFSRIHNLSRSTVSAILHGRMNPQYHGWTFHSNKTRPIKA